jgi:hypothetical protein
MKIVDSPYLSETEFVVDSPCSVAIYVHWSKDDQVTQHDLHVIDSLSKEFNKVLVICNLNSNQPSKTLRVTNSLENVYFVTRKNEGYDFGGYQFGMKQLRNSSENITELLLMNNSVFLIEESLSGLLSKVRNSDSDITGLTDTYERRPHLQSYFLHFAKEVVQSKEIWTWFEGLKTNDDKQETVDSLEIPLMQELAGLGYKITSIWKFSILNEFMFSSMAANLFAEFRRESGVTYRLRTMKKGEFHNPTHYMWAYLIEMGFPFIKKDLLKAQALSNLGNARWELYVRCDEIKSLIKDELRVSVRI